MTKRAPYVKGSATSKAAARSIEPELNRLETVTYWYWVGMGPQGATDDEAEKELGLRHQTVSARRCDLVRRGLLGDSGRRRRTRSGRTATVWVVRA